MSKKLVVWFEQARSRIVQEIGSNVKLNIKLLGGLVYCVNVTKIM